MKKQTKKNSKVLQQGGLMIEALAMLGLIAVVTPTMYKKSAERTLEVEDINTASTVRTYMTAAESFVANNYAQLMTNVFSEPDPENPNKLIPKPDGTVYAVNTGSDEFKSYLPYSFKLDRALYDYNTPQVRVVNQGTNLTAFVLFPAKQGADDGIGQERTARIAALVGSTGGYMPDNTTARGVGGLWSLDAENFSSIFAGQNPNPYSLVAASSNVISDIDGGQLDNDKYLQRTLEEGENQLWRNTMHTDLYMGNHLPGETQSIREDLRARNSIRDVKSMIINAETAPTSTDEEGNITEAKNHGLYIAGTEGSDYSDAYIGGAIRAAEEQFVVSKTGNFNENSQTSGAQMVFGKTGGGYAFEVDENGDIFDYGTQGMLFNNFKQASDHKVDIADNVIEISNVSNIMKMHLMDDDSFRMEQNPVDNKIETYISANGYRGIDNVPGGQNQNIDSFYGHDSMDEEIGPKYTSSYPEPKFSVKIGSNTKVMGILAAGQIDVQHLRTASFQSGSEYLNEPTKWLEVDKNGVRIRDPRGYEDHNDIGGKVSLIAEENQLAMRVGDASRDYSANTENFTKYGLDDHQGQMVLKYKDGAATIAGQAHEIRQIATDNGSTAGYIKARNSKVQAIIGGNKEADGNISAGSEITISAVNPHDENILPQENYRVHTIGGNVDLHGSNLHVTDENGNQVFSVRGNERQEGNSFDDSHTNGNNAEYSVAAHGNVIFTGGVADYNDVSSTAADRRGVKYMSVGKYNRDAGINISAGGKTEADYVKNVLLVDESEDYNSTNLPETGVFNNVAQMDPGTVYIRKGMINVHNSPDDATKYDAATGTGIVRASRFVANNSNSTNREAYKVPEQLTSAEYNAYNGGAGNTRYDTYMVNPAYTSVMNDIKLTTRGGARLSDILPDFINKGIYVANNTNKETAGNTNFSYSGYNDSALNYQTAGANEWVSPYLGKVPAPQCPPGYGRVITVAPVGFEMAQAGGLSFDPSAGGNGAFYASEDKAGAVAFARGNYSKLKQAVNPSDTTVSEDAIIPTYREVRTSPMAGSSQVHLNGTFTGHGTDEHTLSDIEMNFQIDNDFDVTASTGLQGKTWESSSTESEDNWKTAYILSSTNADAVQPIIFQQSTYLKTVAIPLKAGVSTSFTNTHSNGGNESMGGNTNYTQGWAIIMGFIYPDRGNKYANIIADLGNRQRNFANYEGTNWYWNIFPVRKGSLEAYATVYCYFDRENIFQGYQDRSNIDTYDYLHNPATDYVPQNSTYRQKLNDPTLKYNELW